MRGTFNLTAGQEISILVGQSGQIVGGTVSRNSGGGGGSFVWVSSTETLLIAAGGGGGSHKSSTGADNQGRPGVHTPAGTTKGDSTGTPGVSGNGTLNGAGWLSNGGTDQAAAGGGVAPRRPLEGGVGGQGHTETTHYGGFGGGGGGGGSPSTTQSCGGGGGYSGGAGVGKPASKGGGGGGSFNSGTDQVNETGVNLGHGYVSISPPTGESIDPALIPGLDASVIVSGVLNPSRLPPIEPTTLLAGSSDTGALRYAGVTRTPGALYAGSTAPSASTRLNYDGDLFCRAFTGVGTGLTALSASNLTTGTIPGHRGQLASETGASFLRYSGHTQLSGCLYGGTASPTNSVRLNYDGDLFCRAFTGIGSGLTSLNAGNITTGTLAEARLPTNISANRIVRGPLGEQLSWSVIPSLDASFVTTGTFALQHIPQLDSSWISSGLINPERGVVAGSIQSTFLQYRGTARTTGCLYGGTTNPFSSTRLNYDGHLHATLFNANSFQAGNISTNTLVATSRITGQTGFNIGSDNKNCITRVFDSVNGVSIHINEQTGTNWFNFGYRGENVDGVRLHGKTEVYGGPLRVWGEVYSNAYYNNSDDRLKEDEVFIMPDEALDVVSRLRPTLYRKKRNLADDTPTHDLRLESGLMAQEIWYDAPELRHHVHPGVGHGDIDAPPVDYMANRDDPNLDPDYSAWGPREATVDYIGLVPWLIAACQGLAARNMALETSMAALEERVHVLEVLPAKLVADRPPHAVQLTELGP
jgi:hypothetical protein